MLLDEVCFFEHVAETCHKKVLYDQVCMYFARKFNCLMVKDFDFITLLQFYLVFKSIS